MKIWCLASVLVLLSACAPTTYSRPDTSESQLARDTEACRLEGRAYYTERLPRAEDYNVTVWGTESAPADLSFDLGRAAERAVKDEHEQYFERQVSRYVPDCMRSKGYRAS